MDNQKKQDTTKDVKKDLGRYERDKSFLFEIFVFVFIVFAALAIVIAIHKKSVKNQQNTQQVQTEQSQSAEEQVETPELITEIDESKIVEKEYTQEELETLALEYCEAKKGIKPAHVESELTSDGLLRIHLSNGYDEGGVVEEFYTVDVKTAVGTDSIGNKINLNDK